MTWPRGTYGLYMPRTGCPRSTFPWHQGWLYQDVEDIGASNVFSDTLHLYGEYACKVASASGKKAWLDSEIEREEERGEGDMSRDDRKKKNNVNVFFDYSTSYLW